jgi:hypothetical protein
MGFSVRVAKGVRISASPRGIRTSLGPRAARIHLGAGRPGVSTGAGRYTYWAPVGGSKKSSKSSPGPTSRTSVAAYQRQLNQAEKQEEIERIRELEATLVSLHTEPFPPAQRPIAPEPEPVDFKLFHRRIRAEELSKVPLFRLSERRAAKKRADVIARLKVEEEQAKRIADRNQFQSELDEEWTDLNANKPEIVMAALEAAFEDNQDPAAPVDCEGRRASIIILYPPQDFMPDKKSALTPTGKLTLKRRNKTETSDLYARAMASTVLATVKEGFAVAPGLEEITTLVARKDSRADDPQDYMAAIYAGTFSRDRIQKLDWEHIDALEEIYIAPDAMLKRKGSTATLTPLDLSKEPDLKAVIEQLKDAL